MTGLLRHGSKRKELARAPMKRRTYDHSKTREWCEWVNAHIYHGWINKDRQVGTILLEVSTH